MLSYRCERALQGLAMVVQGQQIGAISSIILRPTAQVDASVPVCIGYSHTVTSKSK